MQVLDIKHASQRQARSKLLKDSGPSKTINALLVLSAGEEAINCPSRWLAWTTHQMKHPSRHCWNQSYDTTMQMVFSSRGNRVITVGEMR